MAKKEESEIEVLKKKVKELSSEIDRYANKLAEEDEGDEYEEDEEEEWEDEEENITKRESKKFVWVLVFLVIVLLVVDIFSLYVYYKPDLSGFTSIFKINFGSNNSNSNSNSNPEKIVCSDGTPYGSCAKNKPYYCYQGTLLKSANACGCPAGYVQNFQDCKLA